MSGAPTYVQLFALVGELSARVEEQSRVIAGQAERIAELERRLGQNSRNSSRSPASDAFDNKPPRSVRKKAERRPGKQRGSPGSALRQVDDPDEVVDHVPSECGGCGGGLAGVVSCRVVRRQVRDVPEVTTTVTERRLYKRRCGCGRVTTAAAPAGVNASAVYGPNLRALAVYLLVYQHVRVTRAAELIADVTGARCSTGWISSVLVEASDVLADVEELIKTMITLAHLLHVDETSMNVNGAKQLLHVSCTDKLTACHLHTSGAGSQSTPSGCCPASPGSRCMTRSASTTGPTTRPRPTPCAVPTSRANWSPRPIPTPTRPGPQPPWTPYTA